MKLAELVREVVENDIPPMSTRTYTEVARLAVQKDPGGRPSRVPGPSSAAKIVKGIPQQSNLPWHRVVYGDGDLVRQSKRKKAQWERLQEEGARPRTDESIQAWATRIATPYVACYHAVLPGASSGAAVFTAASDPRIQEWPAERVEPIFDAEEAERRGFTRLPGLFVPGAQGTPSTSYAAEGLDPQMPATVRSNRLSPQPSLPPALPTASQPPQRQNAEAGGRGFNPDTTQAPHPTLERPANGGVTAAGSGRYSGGPASWHACQRGTGPGTEMEAAVRQTGAGIHDSTAGSHIATCSTCLGLREPAVEAAGPVRATSGLVEGGPRPGVKRRREEWEREVENAHQGTTEDMHRVLNGPPGGSGVLPEGSRAHEGHARLGTSAEMNRPAGGNGPQGVGPAGQKLHVGMPHQTSGLPTDDPGHRQSEQPGGQTPRATSLLPSTSQELFSPPFYRGGLGDYLLGEGDSPSTHPGRQDFLADYYDTSFDDHHFSTVDLMPSRELQTPTSQLPPSTWPPAAADLNLPAGLSTERVGSGDPPAAVIMPSEAFGDVDGHDRGARARNEAGFQSPGEGDRGVGRSGTDGGLRPHVAPSGGVAFPLGPAEATGGTVHEDGGAGTLSGVHADADAFGGEARGRGDGAAAQVGAERETLDIIAGWLAPAGADLCGEVIPDGRPTDLPGGVSCSLPGDGRGRGCGPINGRQAGAGDQGTNGMRFGALEPIPQRDGADDEESEDEQQSGGADGEDTEDEPEGGGNGDGADKHHGEGQQRRKEIAFQQDEGKVSRDGTCSASAGASEEAAQEPVHKKPRLESGDDTVVNAVRNLDVEAVRSGLLSKGFFHAPRLLSPLACESWRESLPAEAQDGFGFVEVKQVPGGVEQLREELYHLSLSASMQILNGSTIETDTQLTLPDQLGEHWQRCAAMGLRPAPAYTVRPRDGPDDLPQQGIAGDQRLRVPIQAGVLLSGPTKGSAAALVVSETSSDGHKMPQVQSEVMLEEGDVVLVCTGGRPADFQGGMAGKRMTMHFSVRGSPDTLYMALPFDAEH